MKAQKIIDQALTKADSAHVKISRSESAGVSYENDQLKSAGTEQTTGVGLRVIVNGKVGSAHGTDTEDIDGLVNQALEAAEFGSPAHYEFPGPAEGSPVKTWDDDAPNYSMGDMVKDGAQMLDIIKDYNKDILVDTSMGRSVKKIEFANSAGQTYEHSRTSIQAYASGQLIRGTDMLWAGHGRSWCGWDETPKQIAEKALEYFRMAEQNAPISSGSMPVVFTPSGLMVLLLALQMGINGKNVVMGNSPLADKLNTEIADTRINIYDDPLIDMSPTSSSFDGEGVPRKQQAIIENGKLANFLYDLDAAGRADTVSTGNGPGCSPAMMVVEPGDTGFDEMIADIKEGLLVHSVLGLGQGNAISGEFSVNVHLGYKIENGTVAGRVKDVMLAGNTYDALKDIACIGDTPEWGHGMYAPHVKVNALNVTAK